MNTFNASKKRITDLRCQTTAKLAGLPKLKRKVIAGKRHYVSPSGEIAYPSVTSVLSVLTNQKALDEWAQRVGPEEAASITKFSADRGTALHKMFEDNLFDPSLKPEAARSDIAGMYSSMRRELNKSLTEVHGVELFLYSNVMQMAGTADLIGVWDGVLSVIDFKNSRKPKRREWIDHYFLQTTAYGVMFEELTGLKCRQNVILIGVDGCPAQVFVEPRTNANMKELARARLLFNQNQV